MARRVHRILNRDFVDRPTAAIAAEVDVTRPTLRKSRARLFHVDRQCADRRNLHAIEMALRACFRRVELPPEISAGVDERRLLLNRFFADKRMVPGKIIESPPAIEDDELPPSI